MAIDLPIRSSTPRSERDDCCGSECAYRPDVVKHHLSVLDDFDRAGEIAGSTYASPVYDSFGGSPGDGRTALIDVRRVVGQLVAEGQEITAEAVSARLCPWASDACD